MAFSSTVAERLTSLVVRFNVTTERSPIDVENAAGSDAGPEHVPMRRQAGDSTAVSIPIEEQQQ